MDEQLLSEVIMPLILQAGDAKSLVMEAIYKAKSGAFDLADQKIAEAEEALNRAHHIQTKLLQDEASGNNTTISLLLLHSQDHLMTSIAVKDLAIEIIELHRLKQDKA